MRILEAFVGPDDEEVSRDMLIITYEGELDGRPECVAYTPSGEYITLIVQGETVEQYHFKKIDFDGRNVEEILGAILVRIHNKEIVSQSLFLEFYIFQTR
jgi:hypothetical protein